MSALTSYSFRDLSDYVELHQVSSSPASDTPIDVWAKVVPSSTSVINVVIHNGFGFDQLGNDDWRLWYFVWAGFNWVFSMFYPHPGGRLVTIECRSTNSLDTSGLSDLDTFNNDDDAATAGVAVGGFYVAGSEHERASTGSVTSRLS